MSEVPGKKHSSTEKYSSSGGRQDEIKLHSTDVMRIAPAHHARTTRFMEKDPPANNNLDALISETKSSAERRHLHNLKKRQFEPVEEFERKSSLQYSRSKCSKTAVSEIRDSNMASKYPAVKPRADCVSLVARYGATASGKYRNTNIKPVETDGKPNLHTTDVRRTELRSKQVQRTGALNLREEDNDSRMVFGSTIPPHLCNLGPPSSDEETSEEEGFDMKVETPRRSEYPRPLEQAAVVEKVEDGVNAGQRRLMVDLDTRERVRLWEQSSKSRPKSRPF